MAEVIHTIEAHVATVVLSNEERMNAMSLAMWRQLADTLSRLQTERDLRVLVLRGHGDRAFVSGADISEFASQRSSAQGVADYDSAVDAAQTALAQFPLPVIAAVSGICYGGGLGLALACDLRYASPSARFRMPAARLGLGYAYRSMKSLVDSLGQMAAAEAFYSARVYGASAAQQMGLVLSVHDDVFAYCQALAQQIAENAPLTIRAGKRAMIGARHAGPPPDFEAIDAAVNACFVSEDYAEGRQAFAQKRSPRFQGR
ncbi:MAG: enoyl-CoA hydratase [Burkholderiaceae bacterium]